MLSASFSLLSVNLQALVVNSHGKYGTRRYLTQAAQTSTIRNSE